MSVLIVVQSDGKEIGSGIVDAIRLGRGAADRLAVPLIGLIVGDRCDVSAWHECFDELWLPDLVGSSGGHPEAWGRVVVERMRLRDTRVVVGIGDDRGHEVLAHVAAMTGLPLTTNVIELELVDSEWFVTRYRWGGNLLEYCSVTSEVLLASAAQQPADTPLLEGRSAATFDYTPYLDVERIASYVEPGQLDDGISLASARVVVSGGRGVGSAEGFRPLEELAVLVGGAIGCSRVATNNGWRPHSDQVGQTGTKVAPELYIACGISGATQHWIGMIASKTVLAIDTDPDAPMMQKADYAVVADVTTFVPALVEEIRRRS